jgi:ATP diphosphatase
MTSAIRKSASPSAPPSVLDGIPDGLPELERARRLKDHAARIGFDWTGPEGPLDKFAEEIAEMRQAVQSGDRAQILDELGDLFLVLTILARTLRIDSEEALQHACDKFERRFRAMENLLRDVPPAGPETWSLAQRESAWKTVKIREKQVESS